MGQVAVLLMLKIILDRWNICCEYKYKGPRGHLYSVYLYKRPCVVIDIDWDRLYTGDVFG